MSFKIEVLTKGAWSGNALRFETHEEADAYGSDLLMRWLTPERYRVVETEDPVTHIFHDGVVGPVPEPVKVEPDAIHAAWEADKLGLCECDFDDLGEQTEGRPHRHRLPAEPEFRVEQKK